MDPLPSVFFIMIGYGFELSNSKRWLNRKRERNRKVNTKRERDKWSGERERNRYTEIERER